MINENHIIKFKYSFGLYNNLDIDDDFFIKSYASSIDINNVIIIIIRYNNLDIYNCIPSNYYNYIFNLSNMLHKLHTKNYYCRYNHNCKELI